MSMTSQNKDFYGKEVTDAIQKACKELQVPQEQLEIEVVETGSSGIFGLIRKKAHIRAQIKKSGSPFRRPKRENSKTVEEKAVSPVAPEKEEQEISSPEPQESPPVAEEKNTAEEPVTPQPAIISEPEIADDTEDESEDDVDMPDDQEIPEEEELPEESLLLIKEELSRMLDLMGYPSQVEVSGAGTSVLCHVGEEHEDILTGQDGKTLDSIQYLLRKIIARKVPNRLRLTVDIGNYREKRLSELKERALELAEMVKADGKTQVIAALSPSERRVIHMSLQEDKEIRSRSVGDGLFKKILIYKPGKGGKSSGRKRNNSRGRRGQSSRKKASSSED